MGKVIDAAALFQAKRRADEAVKRKLVKNRSKREYEDEVEVQRDVRAVGVEKDKLRSENGKD